MTFRGVISYGPTTTPGYLGTQTSFDNILAAPLDGVVMDVLTDDGTNLSNRTYYTNRQWTMVDLVDSMAALSSRVEADRSYLEHQQNGWTSAEAINGWGKCHNNLVHIALNGTLVDPFDPHFDTVYNNLVLLGQFAAHSGLAGVWFDVEAYITGQWQYSLQPRRATYTFIQYQQKWYAIGYALALEWRSASRDINVMFTSAYDGYAGRGAPFESNEWGLYRYFLDGFLDAWGNFQTNYRAGDGRVILTTEVLYRDRTVSHVERYGLGEINGTYDIAAPPPNQLYWGSSPYFFSSEVVEHGLALWIDAAPFDPNTPSSNYWTPSVFGDVLEEIMRLCDWAWIYNPTYHLYPESPFDSNLLSTPYLTVINDLRQANGLPG